MNVLNGLKKGSATSSEELKQIGKNNAKTPRFYKVLPHKSGLISSRDTISRKDFNKRKKIKNRSKYALNKHNLTQFQNNNLVNLLSMIL
jgi:hypothetical protein